VVLDSSALFALLVGEPEADRMAVAVENDPVRLVSAATLVEVATVVEARLGDPGARELDALIQDLSATTVPVTSDHAAYARRGFREYGKGRHRAALNFGDVFAYALAAASGEALLFKGDDFVHTDVAAVEY
jgi:ribonuclease VapC